VWHLPSANTTSLRRAAALFTTRRGTPEEPAADVLSRPSQTEFRSLGHLLGRNVPDLVGGAAEHSPYDRLAIRAETGGTFQLKPWCRHPQRPTCHDDRPRTGWSIVCIIPALMQIRVVHELKRGMRRRRERPGAGDDPGHSRLVTLRRPSVMAASTALMVLETG